MRFAFPVFAGAEELDLAGPWEALALARDYGERDVELLTVAAAREPVRLRGGLRVVPDAAFGSEPAPDAIVVPGGPGTRDKAAWTPVVAWVAARRATPLVASVCTGAFLLARAGLLAGRRATPTTPGWTSCGRSIPTSASSRTSGWSTRARSSRQAASLPGSTWACTSSATASATSSPRRSRR